MADILSIASIIGLAWVGKKLTDEKKEEYVPSAPINVNNDDNISRLTNTYTATTSNDEGFSGTGVTQSRKFEQGNVFNDISPDRYPGGLPYYLDEVTNPYVSGVMNNVTPVEKNLVGPGLGVGPDTPAFGGYQQLFRVMPNNVGAYKLTTLPGRTGPMGDITGGKQTLAGQINHKMPAKTAYLPSRRPEQMGRAQGQGGAATAMTVYGKQERTKRPTNRSETTTRSDGLSFSSAKSVVSGLQMSQDPTRNKGDQNMNEYYYMNNPTPGINSFHGGYINNVALQTGNRTNKELEALGFRPTDKRSQPDRSGNAGRMNVRSDPLSQGGAVTTVRMDQSRVDGWTGQFNGQHGQTYVKPQHYDLNSYKGMENPRACPSVLGTAHKQMTQNSLSTATF